jgi:hypothetical protein
VPATFQPGVLKPFELTIYCDTDKFSSNLCRDEQTRHQSERLARERSGSLGGSPSVGAEKWRVRSEDIKVSCSLVFFSSSLTLLSQVDSICRLHAFFLTDLAKGDYICFCMDSSHESRKIDESNLLGQGGYGVVYKGTYQVRKR